MLKHTPGPWYTRRTEGGYRRKPKQEVRRLLPAYIAGAPELLEALSELLNASNPRPGVYCTATEAECEKARAAIAKATSAQQREASHE